MSQAAPVSPARLLLTELTPLVEVGSCFRVAAGYRVTYPLFCHHLILVQSGRLRGGPPGQEIEARAGDLVCFRPTQEITYAIPEETVLFQIGVRFAPPPAHRLTPWVENVGLLPMVIRLGEHLPAVRECFESVFLELPKPGPAHRLRVQSAVLELVALTVEAIRPRATRHAKPEIDAWERSRLRMQMTLEKPVRISALAAEARVGLDQFIRVFRRRFGLPPREYQMRLRLQEAYRWLRTTDRSVKEIAFGVGFRDPRTFDRRFKQHMGLSPSAARAQLTQRAPAFPTAPRSLPYPANQLIFPAGRAFDWRTGRSQPQTRQARG